MDAVCHGSRDPPAGVEQSLKTRGTEAWRIRGTSVGVSWDFRVAFEGSKSLSDHCTLHGAPGPQVVTPAT